MKNKFMLLAVLMMSISMLGQKKELKVAAKLLKKGSFNEALAQLDVVKPLLKDADNKYQLQYLYIKAMSIFANGKAFAKDKAAGEALNELRAYEKEIGSKKHNKVTGESLNVLIQRAATSGSKLFSEEKYKAASKKFELVYILSPTDTAFLDNAALSAYNSKEYDRSISLYKRLLEIGYTGISTKYKAVSKINGDEIYYGSKKEMDRAVMLKTAVHPEVVVSPSKTGDIAKMIAFSYIAKGDKQAALTAIADAKKLFPNDYNLVISEANIYFKLGNNEKFLEGLKKAIELRPNDAQLYYNVGVLTLEQGYEKEAIESFEKAIELKPDFSDAYNNIGVAILEKTKPIIEEMNKNLSNFDKYDALMLEQKKVYQEALPYFENTLKHAPKNESVMKTLVGLYELLEMYDKQKEVQAKINAL
ncbi:MAG: tetratricopeptide repeat protein [Flavicella sp.]